MERCKNRNRRLGFGGWILIGLCWVTPVWGGPSQHAEEGEWGCAGGGHERWEVPAPTLAADAFGASCGPRVLRIGLTCDPPYASGFASDEEARNYLALLGHATSTVLEEEIGLSVSVDWVTCLEDPDGPVGIAANTADLHAALRALPPRPEWERVHAVLFWSGEAQGADRQDEGSLCDAGVWLAVFGSSPQAGLSSELRRALHALGHRLGARHTQDFCPPLDECAPMQHAGPCQERWQCPTPQALEGTLMSACHLCPGGWQNVALTFHPINRSLAAQAIESCLWPDLDLSVDAPTTRTPQEPWVVRWRTALDLAGLPWLDVVRTSGGVERHFGQRVGQQTYEVVLPPDPCGTYLEASFGLPTDACGTVPWPHGPGAGPLENSVVEAQLVFADDGTIDRGWASLLGTGSAGFWTRAQPAHDPQWPFGPLSDSQGDGWCYVTDNRPGNSDVDDGFVELLGPWWAISPGPMSLHFDAFFDVVNTNGEDRLVAEVQFDAPGEPWSPVWRWSVPTGLRPDANVLPVSDPRWRSFALPAPVWEALRPPHATQMRIRFVARDGWPPSAVEAGIDRVELVTSGCPQ